MQLQAKRLRRKVKQEAVHLVAKAESNFPYSKELHTLLQGGLRFWKGI